jgi:nucleotide-binding universal stress UspA family protein
MSSMPNAVPPPADLGAPQVSLAGDPAPLRQRQPSRIRTILLATDLTPVSDDATRQAMELAATLGARMLVVNVIDPQPAQVGRPARMDQLRAEREPSLLGIVGRARELGVEATYLLWSGEPGRSIVAAAAAEKADLIVVGTRGLDRAGRFLLGSVSDHVVYHADCPVLVAR